MPQFSIRLLVFWASIILFSGSACAQSTYFFRESTNPGYYDSGLAFSSGNSTLKKGGPTNDKLLLSYLPESGNYSLDITWKSMPGGDWSAFTVAPGFPAQNISNHDTLAFWAMSPQGLSASLLPTISMEGGPGSTKSKKYRLRDFANDLPAGGWVEIKVPLSTFFQDPNQTNILFTQVKAIILGQDTTDAATHTLYIDEVRTFRAESPISLPQPVSGLSATGYERHIDLQWSLSTNPLTAGYRIYRSADGGNTWLFRRQIDKSTQWMMDFVGDVAPGTAYQYQIRSVNTQGRTSQASSPVSASTRAMTDDDFLDMVQRASFRYFYDFAHPVSGLTPERNTGTNTVTTGGSGFGLMAIVVGMERGYISRADGLTRLKKIFQFLGNANRFHGAWPHWMDGTTGLVIPFSQRDNGGDLVETAFMVQGMLSVKQYLDPNVPAEDSLRNTINTLWQGVEFDWYRQYIQQYMFWHWSPNYAWQINFQLRGYNETMITYILGMSSPTHGIPGSCYANGWAGSNYANGGVYYGYPLSVGSFRGGPLFFAHYSFLGFDPRKWKDNYTNYFTHNRNHTLINRAYCIENPKGYAGYGADCWGLTASDNPDGYKAHEPTSAGDDGTLSPTAALSSMPYTPEQSLAALKHFYREHGENLWGPMGFYDAFNLQRNWFARSYLAIDQGPIVAMIENYRTGLFWDLFMQNPEIAPALQGAGFTPDSVTLAIDARDPLLFQMGVYPNPVESVSVVRIDAQLSDHFTLTLYDLQGNKIKQLITNYLLTEGKHEISLNTDGLSAGTYMLELHADKTLLAARRLISVR